MKLFVTLIFSIACFSTGTAQFNDSSSRTLTLEKKDPNLGVKKSDNSDFALKIPSTITISKTPKLLDSLDAKQINMLPNPDLVDPARDTKINPRLGLEEKTDKESKRYFGDQYLGDIKSSTKYVGIVVRDHENVDNDRVKIYLNGKTVEKNILLTGSFKGVNADLKDGFNRIEFEALNEGVYSPNTAQINIYDDLGKLIYANQWTLSTGSKATVIIVK